MELRPYQERALGRIAAGWPQYKRQLLVAATGAGKTIMFSFIAHARRQQRQRTLILVHRKELLTQARDKLNRATGIIASIEAAEEKASLHSDVIIGMVQSMTGRLRKYTHDHFTQVICDEAHLSTTNQWQEVLNHFPQAFVLGVTATPQREDQKQLGKYYENIADEIGLFELIAGGYLTPLTVRTFPLKIDLSGVSLTGGDLNDEELAAALGPFYREIAAALKEYAPGRQTLAFHPLVKSSERFTAVCQECDVSARHIDCDSPDRRAILTSFHNRQFSTLNNPCLLSVGYDEPVVDCILNLRPTRSRIFYTQMVGRATRLSDDPAWVKKDSLILDPLWQFNRMGRGLVTPAHLIGGSDEEVAELTEKLEKDGEINLGDTSFLVQMEKDAKLAKRLLKASGWNGKCFDVQAWAAKYHDRQVVDYQQTMPWQAEPIDRIKQQIITESGFDMGEVKDRGHAAAICNMIARRAQKRLATFKQMKRLAEMGHSENLDKLSYKDADILLNPKKDYAKR